MIKNILPFLGLFIMLLSCSKEKASKSTIENIAGSYKLLKYEAAAGSTFSDFTRDCEKDNIYQFGLDSTYTILDEGVPCSPSGNLNAKWWLTDGGYLGIQPTYSPNTYTIQEFDGKNLTLFFHGGTYVALYHFQ